MRAPALAIGWEFRRRHLWALIAMAGYLLALAAIKLLFLGPMEPIRLDPPDGRVAVVMTPLTATYFYLLAAFSFGLAGDLGARPSIYPARMFALPVGTAAVAILWLVTALSARWPWGIELPLIWPALLAAVFLAWTQALMWMPYGLPGLRATPCGPAGATIFLRPPGLKRGSSGGGMAGRCRRSWVCFCRSSWRCSGSPKTRRLSSSRYYFSH